MRRVPFAVWIVLGLVAWVALFCLCSWLFQSGCERDDYVPGELRGRPWCRTSERRGGST